MCLASLASKRPASGMVAKPATGREEAKVGKGVGRKCAVVVESFRSLQPTAYVIRVDAEIPL